MKTNEKGQGLVQYPQLLILIAIVVYAILAIAYPDFELTFRELVDALAGL